MINEDQLPEPPPPTKMLPRQVALASPDAHKLSAARFWLASQGLMEDRRLQIGFSIPTKTGTVRLAELLEVQRQAGLACVHQVLQAPRDRVFILDAIAIACISDEASGPKLLSAGKVDVKLLEAGGFGPRARRAVLGFTIRAQDTAIGQGSAEVRLVSQAVYERIRHRPAAISTCQTEAHPASPHGTRRVRFAIDSSDPILTDHPSDHVTAMSLACAVERLVCSEPNTAPLVELGMRFHSYAEPNQPSELQLRGLSRGRFSGELLQLSQVMAEFSGRHSAASSRMSNASSN